MGLRRGPFSSFASRIVFPSVGAGAILLGGGNPGRAIRGYTEGIAHPPLPPAPHHGAGVVVLPIDGWTWRGSEVAD